MLIANSLATYVPNRCTDPMQRETYRIRIGELVAARRRVEELRRTIAVERQVIFRRR